MHRSRPITLFVLLVAVSLLLAACGSSTPSATTGDGGGGGTATDGAAPTDGDTASGDTVSMANNQFSPGSLTVAAGTTVTFTDTGSHTVTEGSNGTPVDDPIVDETGGADIEVTFDEPGTYSITCKIHPEMNMTITVEA